MAAPPAATAAASSSSASVAASPLLALPTDLIAVVCSFIPLRARFRALSLVCRKVRSAVLLSVRDISTPRLFRLVRKIFEVYPDLLLHLPNLTGYTAFVRAPHYAALAPRIRRLRVGYGGGSLLDDEIVAHVAKFPSLTSLEVQENNMPGTTTLLQLNAHTLTHLSLPLDERLPPLPPLPRLRSLNLLLPSVASFRPVPCAFTAFAPSLSALTSLAFQPAAPHIPLLCVAPHLRELSVTLHQPTTEGVCKWVAASLPSLTSLRLTLEDSVDAHIMQLLRATRCVVAFEALSDTPVDQAALADALVPHTKLRTLVLRSPEEGFDYLLERIGSRLTCAALVDASATPGGMIHLSNLEKIYLTSQEIPLLQMWPHPALRNIKIDPCEPKAGPCEGVAALVTILHRFPAVEYVRTCLCGGGGNTKERLDQLEAALQKAEKNGNVLLRIEIRMEKRHPELRAEAAAILRRHPWVNVTLVTRLI